MNIQKVVRALHAFYEESLGLAPSSLPLVDEGKVEQADTVQLVKLLELVLGCAVQVGWQ